MPRSFSVNYEKVEFMSYENASPLTRVRKEVTSINRDFDKVKFK